MNHEKCLNTQKYRALNEQWKIILKPILLGLNVIFYSTSRESKWRRLKFPIIKTTIGTLLTKII